MKSKIISVAAALMGCTALTCTASAQSLPELKFSGFGTFGVVHSSEKNADFIGTFFQPNGAGHTADWAFGPDTVLGGQVGAVFNDKFSGVLQLISKHQYDNSWTPGVEWANLKFQATTELSVRLGRIAAPSNLLSESRYVGYASPWVRMPTEVYGVQSITNNDGVDATYRSQIAGANNTVQAIFGRSSVKTPDSKTEAKQNWGLVDTVEMSSLTLRAGYNRYNKVNLTNSSLSGLLDGFSQLGAAASAAPVPAYQAVGAQALALRDKYKLNDLKVSAVSLGLSYDPGSWFAMSEYVDYKGDGLLSSSRSWYASVGYRLGKFTPYLINSVTRARVSPESISTTGADAVAAGAAALTAGLNASLYAITATQTTRSAGVRWDFMPNVAVKAQYDRLVTGDMSAGKLLTFPGVALSLPAKVNVFSVALDFVF